jgi:hypothetical protein
MMHPYRETFRRHRLRYLLPALLAAVAVAGATYKAPSYVSTASLWVDNQVSGPSSLSVGPGNVQTQTPSSAEQSVLAELLTTKEFDAAVVTGAGLGHVTANSTSPLLSLVSSGITSTTPGPQVLTVTSTASSAAQAHALVQSVITQLQDFSQKWAHEFAASAVAYYEAQVASANHDQAEAQASGSRSAQNSASSALSTATSGLSQAQAELNGQNSFTTVSVLDQPTFDDAPTAGLSGPIEKGFGGAIAALLASFLVIVMRTPGGRDKWDEEMADPNGAAPGGMPMQPGPDGAMPAMVYMPMAAHPSMTAPGAMPMSAPMTPPPPSSAPTVPRPIFTPADGNGNGNGNGHSSSSHALRRHGLLTRKTVMPQQHDYDKPSSEGGLA